jgi:hypothetical protein
MKTSDFEIGKNFIASGTSFPWGTLYQDVCAAFPPMRRDEYGCALRASVPCKEAYGLVTEYAELFASAPDRPVTAIRYDLSCTAEQMAQIENADYFSARISASLGPSIPPAPSSTYISHMTTRDKSKYPVQWQQGGVALILSLYGAPKPVFTGQTLGGVFLNWEDTIAAAQPYLLQLQEEERKLQDVAEGIDSLTTFILEDDPGPNPTQVNPVVRAERCLRKCKVMETPPSVRAKLPGNTAALWKNSARGKWGASTAWETVMFSQDEPVKVIWLTAEAGRGPGYGNIVIGDLTIQSPLYSPRPAALAASLQEMPHTTIEKTEGIDE